MAIQCEPIDLGRETDYLIFTLDSLFIVNFVGNLILCILLFTRSIRPLNRYRKFIFAHHFVSFLNDIHLNFVFKPVILIPFTMTYSRSFVSKFLPVKYSISLFALLGGATLLSYAHLFIVRYLSAQGKHFFNMFYMVFILALYTTPIPAFLGTFECNNENDNQELLNATIEEYSCLAGLKEQHPSLYIVGANCLIASVLIPAAAAVLLAIAVIFFFAALTLNWIGEDSMSKECVKVHKNLLYQLLLMKAIPISLITLPCLYYIARAVAEERYYPELLSFLTGCSSLFSICSVFTIIYFNRCYREGFMEFIKGMPNNLKSPIVIITDFETTASRRRAQYIMY